MDAVQSNGRPSSELGRLESGHTTSRHSMQQRLVGRSKTKIMAWRRCRYDRYRGVLPLLPPTNNLLMPPAGLVVLLASGVGIMTARGAPDSTLAACRGTGLVVGRPQTLRRWICRTPVVPVTRPSSLLWIYDQGFHACWSPPDHGGRRTSSPARFPPWLATERLGGRPTPFAPGQEGPGVVHYPRRRTRICVQNREAAAATANDVTRIEV